jgi:hypothetical protein
VLTVGNRDWFPRGRSPSDDSVWKAAGDDGVVIACTPEFWKELGYVNNLESRAGARLKLLVQMANGQTFTKLRFTREAGREVRCDDRLTWHVVPSMDALMAQAQATSVQDLDAMLNRQAKHSKLRTMRESPGAEPSPSSSLSATSPLMSEDEGDSAGSKRAKLDGAFSDLDAEVEMQKVHASALSEENTRLLQQLQAVEAKLLASEKAREAAELGIERGLPSPGVNVHTRAEEGGDVFTAGGGDVFKEVGSASSAAPL